MEQLAWMYQSCAVPAQLRAIDPTNPEAVFPALQREKVSGVLELISDGRVSYVRLEEGRFASGYFCDKPEALPVGKFIETQFQERPGGAAPAISAAGVPPAPPLPLQAPDAAVHPCPA